MCPKLVDMAVAKFEDDLVSLTRRRQRPGARGIAIMMNEDMMITKKKGLCVCCVQVGSSRLVSLLRPL